MVACSWQPSARVTYDAPLVLSLVCGRQIVDILLIFFQLDASPVMLRGTGKREEEGWWW